MNVLHVDIKFKLVRFLSFLRVLSCETIQTVHLMRSAGRLLRPCWTSFHSLLNALKNILQP